MNTGSLNCSHSQKMSKSGIHSYSHLGVGIMLHVVLSAYAMRQPRNHVAVLPGFKPVSADVWSKGNVPRECVRETALHCTNNSDVQNDGFLLTINIDWLDSLLSLDIRSDKECESACLNKCLYCLSYSCNLYIYIITF